MTRVHDLWYEAIVRGAQGTLGPAVVESILRVADCPSAVAGVGAIGAGMPHS